MKNFNDMRLRNVRLNFRQLEETHEKYYNDSGVLIMGIYDFLLKAEEILPKEVIEIIQQYISGANIYMAKEEST